MESTETAVSVYDPKLFMAEMLTVLGKLTKEAISAGDIFVIDEITPKIQLLEDKFKALDANGDLADRLVIFDDLLNSLDLNKNSKIVDDILNILSIAKTANKRSLGNQDKIKLTNNRLAAANDIIRKYGVRIQNIETAIGSLEESIDQIFHSIRRAIDSNNAAMVAGINAGFRNFADALGLEYDGPFIGDLSNDKPVADSGDEDILM